MPAPNIPNTAAATATRLRQGDQAAAARLRARGHLVVLAEDVPAETPAELAADVITYGNDHGAEEKLWRLLPKLAGVAHALRVLAATDVRLAGRDEPGESPQTRAVTEAYRRMLTAIAGDQQEGSP